MVPSCWISYNKEILAEVNGYRIFKHEEEVFNGTMVKYRGTKESGEGATYCLHDIFEAYSFEQAYEYAANDPY